MAKAIVTYHDNSQEVFEIPDPNGNEPYHFETSPSDQWIRFSDGMASTAAVRSVKVADDPNNNA